MKDCPKCGKSYADDSLNFCLDDGEWLIGDADHGPGTDAIPSPHETSEDATRSFDQVSATEKTSFNPQKNTPRVKEAIKKLDPPQRPL